MTFSMPRGFLALLPLFLAACSTTPLTTPVAPAGSAPVPAAPSSTAATPAPAAAPKVLAAHLDPNSPLSRARSVLFEFDSSLVTQEFMPVVEQHGKYLAGNTGLQARVEGNTDERGGSEYNLALGQRRAEAVVKALQLQGVKTGQVEAVSYGKERPKASGHDEASWKQNRRADIAYVPGR